ncbi:hypothetical protein [Brassicibacter mesophilus]|uniref:hypothetical protein n=1 Tax=Brassicibacter mesophilus TaxID=745119 RepID=UPI003D1B75B1
MGKCSEGYSGLNPVKNDDIMRMLTILTIFADYIRLQIIIIGLYYNDLQDRLRKKSTR